MSTTWRDDQLAWEQAVNERYLDRDEAKAKEAGGANDDIYAAPASAYWVDRAPKRRRRRSRARPLVGRVLLTTDVDGLGRSFYIGSGFMTLEDDTRVVNLAAPVAQLFFLGRAAQAHSLEAVNPQDMAASRTFTSHGDTLVDFEDEYQPGVERDSAFPSPNAVVITAPPGAMSTRPTGPSKQHKPKRRRSFGDRRTGRDRLSEVEVRSAADSDTGATEPPRSPTPPSAGTATTASGVPHPGDQRGPDLEQAEAGAGRPRAERLLMDAIRAPKTGELASVLSTLQPEQYQLVTWPSEQNLVVQGHPGTGKTIVAAHRAAYLVLPRDERDSSPRLQRVALVGPSDLWRSHMRPAVSRLVDAGVELLSLESQIRAWAGGLTHDLFLSSERELHSRWGIGRVIDLAFAAQRHRLHGLAPDDRMPVLVNSLVQDSEIHRRFAPKEGRDLSEWLLDAGSFEAARSDPSYLLLLAAAGVAAGVGSRSSHQHIVVDEAQDIRPIEWWMLSKMFRAGTDARWSLFGDMNQRRSGVTWQSWSTLADRLELAPSDEPLLEPEILHAGYRSTLEILDFAGALLPQKERVHRALRSGAKPTVRQVGPTQLALRATEQADRLASRYGQGSIAVIAWDQTTVDEVCEIFRKRGWRRESTGGAWRIGVTFRRCPVSVVRPAQARGLEFDAVVIVEPAAFEPVDGRHGELYTSLTRANQELVIVHSKAMPTQLRGRGNRVRS